MTMNNPQDDPAYQVGGNKYQAPYERAGKDVVPANTVNAFHTKSDVDSNSDAQHHTLGIRKDQASPGDHTHDGSTSKRLLAGTTLTGSKAGNAALASVVAALVKLGATDSTT